MEAHPMTRPPQAQAATRVVTLAHASSSQARRLLYMSAEASCLAMQLLATIKCILCGDEWERFTQERVWFSLAARINGIRRMYHLGLHSNQCFAIL